MIINTFFIPLNIRFNDELNPDCILIDNHVSIVIKECFCMEYKVVHHLYDSAYVNPTSVELFCLRSRRWLAQQFEIWTSNVCEIPVYLVITPTSDHPHSQWQIPTWAFTTKEKRMQEWIQLPPVLRVIRWSRRVFIVLDFHRLVKLKSCTHECYKCSKFVPL